MKIQRIKKSLSDHPLSLVILFGLFYLFAWIWVVTHRISYPFELEWMEGGQLMHAARLIEGKSIYVEPSTEFIPFFYTPGYPWVVGKLSPYFGGLSFVLGRSISVLSTIWICLLIFWSIFKELTAQNFQFRYAYSFLGILLYMALFRSNGAFYDIARPDSFFLALLFSAIFLIYFFDRMPYMILAGLLMSLAFLSKQTSSVYFPLLCLYLLWKNWKLAIVFALSAMLPTVLSVYLINSKTDGYFWKYIFEGHQGHLFYWKNILLQYWRDVLFIMPILLLLPWLWFYYWAQKTTFFKYVPWLLLLHWAAAYYQRVDDLNFVPHMYYQELFYENPHILILLPPTIMLLLIAYFLKINRTSRSFRLNPFWLLMYMAGVGASGLNHSTQWAYSNCFMLLSISASIFIPLAISELYENFSKSQWVINTILILQLICWFYVPQNQVPSARDIQAVQKLKEELNQWKAPIFAPAHPMLAWDKDRYIHTHQMGIQDVAYQGGVKDLRSKLQKKYWQAIVLDEDLNGLRKYWLPGLEDGYYLVQNIRYADKNVLRTKTGHLNRPISIWAKQDFEQRNLSPEISANYESYQRRYHEQTFGWYSASTLTIERINQENTLKGLAPSNRLQIPTDWSVKPSKYKGQQGDFVLSTETSNLKYPANLASQVTIKSKPFKVQKDLLSFLAKKITNHPKNPNDLLEVKVLLQSNQQVIAQTKAWTEQFQRLELILKDYIGQEVYIEINDLDAKQALLIDDWRWQDIY